MLRGISSLAGPSKIRRKGLLPRLKRLQKVVKSVQEFGANGRVIAPDSSFKHLRKMLYFSS